MHSQSSRSRFARWLFFWLGWQIIGCGGTSPGDSRLISSFTAFPSQVNCGETASLSWTLVGTPTTLTLDGVSVLGQTSITVSPVRRQTFMLAASNRRTAESQSLTLAARGVDLVAGNIGGPGSLDGIGRNARFHNPSGLHV